MALGYRRWVRASLLREEPGPILSESVLQRIWFEQLVRNPLTTLAGEEITLHHPGIWNHRAGPDFLQATFSTRDGRTHVGDVELHRHSSDWSAHQHSANPAYQNVRLHVFWQADPAQADLPVGGIRQIALENQLSAPLTDLVGLFRSSSAEMCTGEKPGRCHPLLLSIPPESLKGVLEEAGWHRLRQRRSLAQARVVSLGYEQAVWVTLGRRAGFFGEPGAFCMLGPGRAHSKTAEDPRFRGESGCSLWHGRPPPGSDAVQGQRTGDALGSEAVGSVVEAEGGLGALYSSCRDLASGRYPAK